LLGAVLLTNSNKMEKKYVVKDFEAQTYYCGEAYGWSKEAYFADYFDSVEDAERFIDRENGKFQIELVYVV
jgi:hypothetical protein